MANDQADADQGHRQARLLRHEVGDLLQSIYSTVAVLMDRLPPEMALERRLIGELKNRAELCKGELDAVVELASPEPQEAEGIDLGSVFAAVLAQVRRRYPALPLSADAPPARPVRADGRVLPNALGLLMAAVCQSARKQVRIAITGTDRHVDCTIERDGYSVTPEQLAWLHTPFSTTQQAAFGLGLALARRAVQSAGGEVHAENRSEGGVVVRIRFPVCADA